MKAKINTALWITLFILGALALMGMTSQVIKIKGGKASWYGPKFHNKQTANGETYDQEALTAATHDIPFDTMVHVLRVSNGNSVNVRINDRGPYICRERIEGKCTQWVRHPTRIIDLSKAAMQELDPDLKAGVIKVKLTWVMEEVQDGL